MAKRKYGPDDIERIDVQISYNIPLPAGITEYDDPKALRAVAKAKKDIMRRLDGLKGIEDLRVRVISMDVVPATTSES